MIKALTLFVLSYCTLSAYTIDDVQKLKLEVSTNIYSFEGWCSVEKALSLIDLVLEVKPKTYVELGVFGGKSLYPVAAAMRLLNDDTASLIAVDPWDRFECIKYYDPARDEAHLRWWGKLNIDFIYSSYLHMLQRFGFENYVETIRATSEEAEPEIGEIDIIHMDGNHSRLVSSLDVVLYLPKVRKGGYIWMNDAIGNDRAEAVEMLKEACDIVKKVDNNNCILFRKR
jgi:predicted O-methyltransferase YrrM